MTSEQRLIAAAGEHGWAYQQRSSGILQLDRELMRIRVAFNSVGRIRASVVTNQGTGRTVTVIRGGVGAVEVYMKFHGRRR